MPRLASEIYATYQDSVLKLASKQGGVSRPQIMDSLSVSRSIADTMIEKCNLKVERKEGRTEFFVLPNGGTPAPATPPVDLTPPPPEPEDVPPLAEPDTLPGDAEAATVVEPNALDRLADVVETDDQVVAAIDQEIADTRAAIKDAALKSGKAMGEWATQQALVDALRERLQELAGRRLALSS